MNKWWDGKVVKINNLVAKYIVTLSKKSIKLCKVFTFKNSNSLYLCQQNGIDVALFKGNTHSSWALATIPAGIVGAEYYTNRMCLLKQIDLNVDKTLLVVWKQLFRNAEKWKSNAIALNPNLKVIRSK